MVPVCVVEGGGEGCIGRGGGTPPLEALSETPFEGAQPMRTHCPPDATYQPQWHL